MSKKKIMIKKDYKRRTKMCADILTKGSRKEVHPLIAGSLRPLPNPPLNNLAISRGTFFAASQS